MGEIAQVHHFHRPDQLHFRLHHLLPDVVLSSNAATWAGAARRNWPRVSPTWPTPDHTYAAALFSTGWFVESLMTQTLIIHVIRTNLIPFIQSRASWQLDDDDAFSSWASARVLPFSPLARVAGIRAAAVAVLADSCRHAALLRRPDASHQDVAGAQKLDLTLTLPVEMKSRSASHGTALFGLRRLIVSAQTSS